MKKMLAFALLWCCSGLWAKAQFFKWGSDKTVPVQISHPPEFGLTVKRVAFGQPGGSCTNEATELVDRMILPDFQENKMDVIERQALDQIMSEHNFSQTAYADPGNAAQLGKILGPSALIIVSMNSCTSEQRPLFNDQKNFNGAVVRTFISKTRYSLEGSLRIVDLTTGQVLGSHNFQSHQEKTNESQQGQPEFPPVDEVKDTAMQDVRFQIHAMFFPSGDRVETIFYDDKDCNLSQVYLIFKNGDHKGALAAMDTDLEECKTGKHKDRSLARAYYDDALLHCIANDYEKASALFTSAMDAKGADAVGNASTACNRARAGEQALKDYEARLAQIQEPPPINSQAVQPQPSASPSTTPVPANAVNAGSPTPSIPGGVPTVEDRLKKLDSLYKSGLLTKKEYDEKRAAILKDL